MEDISEYLTEDIQHDLAMFYADGDKCSLAFAYEAELHRRNERLPTNCVWKRSQYNNLTVAYKIEGD